MFTSSSEMRNLQRLRTPFVTGCAGIFPARASRFTVIGEQRRKSAASSGVTKRSRSNGFIMHTSPVVAARRSPCWICHLSRSPEFSHGLRKSIEIRDFNVSQKATPQVLARSLPVSYGHGMSALVGPVGSRLESSLRRSFVRQEQFDRLPRLRRRRRVGTLGFQRLPNRGQVIPQCLKLSTQGSHDCR
jgi:hypothetical protein